MFLGSLPRFLPDPWPFEEPWGLLGPVLKNAITKVIRLAIAAAKVTAMLDPKKRSREGTKLARLIVAHGLRGHLLALLLTVSTYLTRLPYNFLP
jgi:hypothetical protein